MILGGITIAQDDEVPIKNFQINGLFKNEIGPQFWGTSAFGGIHFTHYINAHWGTEFGVGVPKAGVKTYFYPWQIERGKAKPYLGVAGIFDTRLFNIASRDYNVYFPIGFTWFTNRRWNVSMDAGPSYFNDFGDAIDQGAWAAYFSVKVGYRITFVRFKKRQKQIDVESIPDPN